MAWNKIGNIRGPAGQTGATGAAGASIVGPKGDTGNTGAAGISPVLSIGTVTTLAAGANATATLTGTAANPVLNLGIPRGDVGSAGSAGATGAAGFLDAKSVNLPGITLLAAGTVREYTVTWNYTLPNANYSVTFLPDSTALGTGSPANFTFAVKAGASNKTTTQVVIQVTNNSLLTLGASVVHVIARSS